MRLFYRHCADKNGPPRKGLPGRACGGEALWGPEQKLSGSAQPAAAFRLKAQQLHRRFGMGSILPVQPPDKNSIA